MPGSADAADGVACALTCVLGAGLAARMPAPLIQERVPGYGMGVFLLADRGRKVLVADCSFDLADPDDAEPPGEDAEWRRNWETSRRYRRSRRRS